MTVFNKVNKQKKSGSKSKQKQSKSTERKNSRQTPSIAKDSGKINKQIKFVNTRDQQVNNLSANIQNIQQIKNIKYSSTSKQNGKQASLSNRVVSGGGFMSKQSSAISRIDDLNR